MDNKLKILLRLHELTEYALLSYSADFSCITPRKGYEHEFTEVKETLDLLNELIRERA